MPCLINIMLLSSEELGCCRKVASKPERGRSEPRLGLSWLFMFVCYCYKQVVCLCVQGPGSVEERRVGHLVSGTCQFWGRTCPRVYTMLATWIRLRVVPATRTHLSIRNRLHRNGISQLIGHSPSLHHSLTH